MFYLSLQFCNVPFNGKKKSADTDGGWNIGVKWDTSVSYTLLHS